MHSIQLFGDNDYEKQITIPVIDDNQFNPDTEFYVILKNPTGDAYLGDPSVTRVTIIDDDSKYEKIMYVRRRRMAFQHVHILRPVLDSGACISLRRAKMCQITKELQIKKFIN